jgi:hypothetical protein
MTYKVERLVREWKTGMVTKWVPFGDTFQSAEAAMRYIGSTGSPYGTYRIVDSTGMVMFG